MNSLFTFPIQFGYFENLVVLKLLNIVVVCPQIFLKIVRNLFIPTLRCFNLKRNVKRKSLSSFVVKASERLQFP